MKRQTTDTLYAKPLAEVSDFAFDASVAGVFTDMINRSVPGYRTLLELLGLLAAKYTQADSCIYDLGCSLGAATLMLSQHITAPGCRIISVDNAPAMVEKCRKNLADQPIQIPVDVICADIVDLPVTNASLAVMNLTLQFVNTRQRLPLLKKIHSGLIPGGALFIAEKMEMPNHSGQELFTELHHQFKKAHGYSELEVAQKRTALENVLIPETMETHIARLRKAGFGQIYHCFSCLNFAALLAVK